MEISGPRIGLRAMQLETVLAHVSQQLITCGRVRKHLTVRPEVGAVCEKDACPDLCGGREVTCVPTATAWHNASVCNSPSWRLCPRVRFFLAAELVGRNRFIAPLFSHYRHGRLWTAA